MNILEKYKNTVVQLYDWYAELDYYEIKVTIYGATLISVTNINYEKININKLNEIAPANSQFFDNVIFFLFIHS